MRKTTLPCVLLLAAAVASCAEAPNAADAAAAPTLSVAEATPDQLVDAWIASVGGMEAYWPLKSARFTLTTEIWDAETGRLKRTRPRYVQIKRTPAGELARIERWEGNDFIEQGWDGTEAWARYNGEFLADGDKDLDEVRYVSGDVNYWISLPFKLRDPGVNLHDRGMDGDRRLVAVSFGEGVGLHDGDTWHYWFAQGQAQPVQIGYREEGKENWNLLRFEEVAAVDGYVFAGRRVHYDEEGRLTKVLATTDFELNPEIDDAVFGRPGG